jgi:hypothetical protein
MHSSYTLNNFPIPYREGQGCYKTNMNFLWVGNARGNIAHVAQKPLEHRTVQSLGWKIRRNGAIGRPKYKGRTTMKWILKKRDGRA